MQIRKRDEMILKFFKITEMQVLNSVKYDLIFVLFLKYDFSLIFLFLLLFLFHSWIIICMVINVFFVGEESGFVLNNV